MKVFNTILRSVRPKNRLNETSPFYQCDFEITKPSSHHKGLLCLDLKVCIKQTWRIRKYRVDNNTSTKFEVTDDDDVGDQFALKDGHTFLSAANTINGNAEQKIRPFEYFRPFYQQFGGKRVEHHFECSGGKFHDLFRILRRGHAENSRYGFIH